MDPSIADRPHKNTPDARGIPRREGHFGGVKTKRVLVTGASGFVGRPLVRALLRAGYAVRATARRPIGFPNSVDVAIIPDFENRVDWIPILRDVDIVVHLAGLAHADSRDSAFGTYDQVNWVTTQELAHAANETGVERFVYISSVRAQTGPSAPMIVHEGSQVHPTDHYGRSKLAAEMSLRAAGVPFTILRPVVVYGPHPKGNVRTLVQLAKLRLPLPFAGFNSQRSLLGVENLISAIFFVLNNNTTVGEIFLVADPKPFTLPEIFTMLRKVQGRKPRLMHIPPTAIRLALSLLGQRVLWERINGSLVVDTGKLESLGWRPAVETYDGFRSMLSGDDTEIQ
jgi:nucleoside-diphosphate-sugar epimerase